MAIYDDWSEGVSVQPIHGDCHAGNLLHGENGWFFLDFDDMVVGPAVHDVWMLLPGRDAYAQRQRALFVEAYQQLRSFDTRSLRLIEPLRAFRFVWYAGWIARRWQDPCFPDAFPHFGTEDYWETETRDLEELVERIARPEFSEPEGGEISRPHAAEDESELTNKDFLLGSLVSRSFSAPNLTSPRPRSKAVLGSGTAAFPGLDHPGVGDELGRAVVKDCGFIRLPYE